MKFTHELDISLPLPMEVFFWAASITVSVVALILITNYIFSWLAVFVEPEQNIMLDSQTTSDDRDYSDCNNPFHKAAMRE